MLLSLELLEEALQELLALKVRPGTRAGGLPGFRAWGRARGLPGVKDRPWGCMGHWAQRSAK